MKNSIVALALLFTASSAFAAVTAPGAPQWVTATADGLIATVTFSPPVSNGGAAITRYTVSCNPGCTTASSPTSPIRVSGLLAGTAYTYTVTATNSAGTSAVSAASNSAPVCNGTSGGTSISGYVHGNAYHWSTKIQGKDSGNCTLATGCDGFIDFYITACSNGTTPSGVTGFSSKTLNYGPSYDNTLVDAFYYVRNSKTRAQFNLHPTTSLVMAIAPDK